MGGSLLHGVLVLLLCVDLLTGLFALLAPLALLVFVPPVAVALLAVVSPPAAAADGPEKNSLSKADLSKGNRMKRKGDRVVEQRPRSQQQRLPSRLREGDASPSFLASCRLLTCARTCAVPPLCPGAASLCVFPPSRGWIGHGGVPRRLAPGTRDNDTVLHHCVGRTAEK